MNERQILPTDVDRTEIKDELAQIKRVAQSNSIKNFNFKSPLRGTGG